METEKTKIIEIIKDKYRCQYYYLATTKDFKLEEFKLIKNAKTKEERYGWVFIGWFYGIENVLKWIIKNGCLENEDISTLEKYVEMQQKMLNECLKSKNNEGI
jgi:hypothetical protein